MKTSFTIQALIAMWLGCALSYFIFNCSIGSTVNSAITLSIGYLLCNSNQKLFKKQAYNEAILKASKVVQEPYLKSGMTNTANRAKKAVLNLIKSNS
jgi:positive regulator of sigma E activity